jgi:hypothetical protein
MGKIDRRVLILCSGLAVCLVITAPVLYANDWWLSGIVTVSLFCWLAGVLAAIYGRIEWRPALVAGLAAGFLYVLFALGPWFRGNVAPWLATTRLLAFIDSNLQGPGQTQQVVYQTLPSAYFTSGNVTTMPMGGYGGSGYGGSGMMPGGSTMVTVPVVQAAHSPRIAIGHWLFGWLLGCTSGLGAWWPVKYRRRMEIAARLGVDTRRRVEVEHVPEFPEPQTAAEGENPFQQKEEVAA